MKDDVDKAVVIARAGGAQPEHEEGRAGGMTLIVAIMLLVLWVIAIGVIQTRVGRRS